MSSDRFGSSANYKQKEQGYRDRALKLFPWVCGRCARAFDHSTLQLLEVHHKNNNHDDNFVFRIFNHNLIVKNTKYLLKIASIL